MRKNGGVVVIMLGLAMFVVSLFFAGVSAVNAELRLVKTLCRVVWERDGIKQHEPWQDDCQMVQGWVKDGNDRFPQFKFEKESADIEGKCLDVWIDKKDITSCLNKR